MGKKVHQKSKHKSKHQKSENNFDLNDTKRSFEEIGMDEIDTFHQDTIHFDSDAEHQQASEVEDEDYIRSDEEVLKVRTFDDSSDDASDLDETTKSIIRKMPSLRKQLGTLESEEEISEEEGSDLDANAWGKRKNIYYNDDADFDGNVSADEEEEALRIQKEKLEEANEADFFDDSMLSAAKKGEKSKLALDKSHDGEMLSEVTQELENIPLSIDGVEMIRRDFSSFTPDEATDYLAATAPEFLTLLKDFQTNLELLQTRVQPLLAKLKSLNVPTSKGLSLLELKNQLLLSYCLNLSFYLYLKADPAVSDIQIKEHPVISKLVELRAYIEKLKPIESKLSYQIEKLVKMAKTDEPSSGKDELKYKPNLDNFATENEVVSEDEEEESRTGVYRPPKIAPVAYEEAPEAISRREKYMLKKAKDSRLFQDLMQEVSDKPEELKQEGNVIRGNVERDRAWEERVKVEEEMMIRLPQTRKDKRRMKQQAKYIDELSNLDDFGDSAFLDQLAEEDAQEEKKKSLRRIINRSVPSETQSKKRKSGGDDDLPYQEPKERYRETIDYNTHLNSDQESKPHIDDAFYQEVQQKLKDRKQARAAAHTQMMEDAFAVDVAEETLVDGKRPINYDISKNKGLTPVRSKEQRNPRVKRRKQYEKSLIKLKSFKAVVKDKQPNYAGEETGIKKNLTRSVKF